MKKIIPLCFVVVAFLPSFAAAAIRLVPDDYPTIGAAVNACANDDEVVVEDGIYTGDGNRDIFLDGNITIRSKNGPAGCIIDCNGTESQPHQAFIIRSTVTLAGFTIINGWAEEGGAVYFECCNNNSTIINCVFSRNSAKRQGGALYCRHTTPTIINSSLIGNSAPAGGGIYCEGTKLYMSNCTVSRNSATGDGFESGGGGICCQRESSVILQNCTVSENISRGISLVRGGGIYCMEYSSLTLNNSEIKNNVAESSQTSNGGGIFCSNYSNLTLCDSIVIGNVCKARSCAGGGIYYDSVFNYNTKTCIINGCTIKNNIARAEAQNYISKGGGMYFHYVKPLIAKCIISGNSADAGAGAIFVSSKSIISNSIVSGNFSPNMNQYGNGGICCIDSDTAINNCTIVGNSFFGLYCRNGNTSVINSILYYNYNGNDRCDYQQIADYGPLVVTYSDVQIYEPSEYTWSGEGNINADPCFADSGHWDTNGTPYDLRDDRWVEGNYRLLPKSYCINAGQLTPFLLDSTDIAGNPRISGSRIDIGAYEFKNNPPVADAGMNQKVYAWIDNKAKVALDGSASYDADSQPLSYLWSYTVGGSTYTAHGISPTVELPTGEYTITLVVNNGIENSEPNEVIITVIEPLKSQLSITPQTINRRSQQPHIIAVLQLPAGVTRSQIDDHELLLLYPGQIEAKRKNVFCYFDKSGNERVHIVAFFDKDEIMNVVPDNGGVRLQIVGKLKSGQYFYGIDTVRILALPPRH